MKRQDNCGRKKRDGYNFIAQHAGLLSEVNSRSSFFSSLSQASQHCSLTHTEPPGVPLSPSPLFCIVFCSLHREAQTFVTIY